MLVWATVAHAAAPAEAPAVRDVIGLNEAIALPKRFVLQLPRDERNAAFDSQIALVKALGVRHIRVHSALYPFLSHYGQSVELHGDLSHADAYLTKILSAGLEPLVVIGPWPGNAPAAVTDRYVPQDLGAYASWVQQTVERYDGDGIDDAPGLIGGVHAWEVDNEPDLHNHLPPRDVRKPGFDPSTFSTPAEYQEILRVTATAIRAADATAIVLPGGLFKVSDGPGRVYQRALWAHPDVAPLVAGANIHSYPYAPNTGEVWAGVEAAFSDTGAERLWITETSIPSTGRAHTERTQAEGLAVLVFEALRRGVERVYWHSLLEAPNYYQPRAPRMMTKGRHLFIGRPDQVLHQNGQLRWEDVHRKLSAWTLANLLSLWGEFPRSEVTELALEGARALKLGDDIVVYDPFTTHGLKVRVAFTEVEVTCLVPSQASGGEVDAAPDWSSERQASNMGFISIDLSCGPVRIHPIRSSP